MTCDVAACSAHRSIILIKIKYNVFCVQFVRITCLNLLGNGNKTLNSRRKCQRIFNVPYFVESTKLRRVVKKIKLTKMQKGAGLGWKRINLI